MIRVVEAADSHVPMRLRFRLRFDEGIEQPWSRAHGNGLWCEIGPHQVVLHSPVDFARHEVCGTAEWGGPLRRANDVGLLAEEFHAPTQRMIEIGAHASWRGEHRIFSVGTRPAEIRHFRDEDRA